MTGEPILQTNNLSKRFKQRWVVRGLNLQVYRGDVFGFLGPNGAGKSTTIRMLLSLVKPTEGDVFLFGRSIRTDREPALRPVGGIVEKPDFYLYLSAYRNLEIVGALSGGTDRKRIFEVLDLVGLAQRAYDAVKTYSHGMKQRLGIAQALLCDPELVILDEPTSGLDPQGMKEIRDLIRILSAEQRKTIFLSSHLLHEVEMVANRMAIINCGEMVTQGEVAKLLDEGGQYVVVRGKPVGLVRSVLNRRKEVRSFTEQKGEFRIDMAFEDVPVLNAALVKSGVRVFELVPRRSLEDFFLSMTENETAL